MRTIYTIHARSDGRPVYETESAAEAECASRFGESNGLVGCRVTARVVADDE